jgi:hypothetical protein
VAYNKDNQALADIDDILDHLDQRALILMLRCSQRAAWAADSMDRLVDWAPEGSHAQKLLKRLRAGFLAQLEANALTTPELAREIVMDRLQRRHAP